MWDLRDAAAYAEYHIPTAENVPLASLGDQELPPTEKVILYSDGGIHASQAMMLLWAQGKRNVYTLLGGLDAWKDEVLFPVAPASPSAADQAAFERSVQVARFFGGQPRAAAATAGGAPGASMPMAAPGPPQGRPAPPDHGRRRSAAEEEGRLLSSCLGGGAQGTAVCGGASGPQL